MTDTDKKYMRRAVDLAGNGEGWCHPNPMVGAVIVKDGRVIGEGYHAKYGELHAERNALASLTEDAAGATIYVTLEPCCHTGKTPPCTEAIIAHRIGKVVIGSYDPNPQVSGGGIRQLREAGIEVVTDCMKEECDALNPVFFKFITSSLPYVMLKYAMTADGKIATKTGASRWITGKSARRRVHEMRHAYMSILAGIGTVLADDPLLNSRIVNGRDPIRLICDSLLRIPLSAQVVQTAKKQPTIIFTALTRDNLRRKGLQEKIAMLQQAGVEVVHLPKEGNMPSAETESQKKDREKDAHAAVDLQALLRFLGKRGIDSLMIEGGGTIAEAFLREGLVDEINAFVAPKLFGGNGKTPAAGVGVRIPAEAYRFAFTGMEKVGEDVLLTMKRRAAR